MTEIWIDHEIDDPNVTLHIDEEGAQYIAQVMGEEYARSNDIGAKGIADRISRGLGQVAQ